MEIIQAGRTPSPKVRFSCLGCGCIFDALKDSEAKQVFDQRDGNFWQYACPTCGRNCAVSATRQIAP